MYEMQAMESAQELQAGNFMENMIWSFILRKIEEKFPGAGAFLEQASTVLPWSKIWTAIQTAMIDYQQGKNFLQILEDILSQWMTVERPADGGPIRMTAKPE